MTKHGFCPLSGGTQERREYLPLPVCHGGGKAGNDVVCDPNKSGVQLGLLANIFKSEWQTLSPRTNPVILLQVIMGRKFKILKFKCTIWPYWHFNVFAHLLLSPKGLNNSNPIDPFTWWSSCKSVNSIHAFSLVLDRTNQPQEKHMPSTKLTQKKPTKHSSTTTG